ncbi:hypothetical protein BH10CHL1_BH10CHL1_33900 [soil metagenome]
MLDEALEVLDGLWRGETFSYQGQYYQIEEVKFLPKLVQAPRIPIWIGGGYPKKGPTASANRWDGACLFRYTGSAAWLDMTPDDVRALKTFVAEQRRSMDGYAIAIGGRERHANWAQERAYIRSIAEAGATWWMEALAPAELDQLRSHIKRGPLRID